MLTLEQAKNQIDLFQIKDQLVQVDALDVNLVGESLLVKSEAGQFMVGYKKALGSFKDHTGINIKSLLEYQDDPDLTKKMIDHSLQKRVKKQIRFVSSGTDIWEILDKEYPWVCPTETFGEVTRTLEKETDILGLSTVEFDDQLRCVARFVTKEAKVPSKSRRDGTHDRVNDFSHSGIWLRCNGKVETCGFVYRMVCSNGLMREHRMTEHKTNSGLLESIQKNTLLALQDSRKSLDEFLELADQPVDNPALFINHVARVHHYPARMVTKVIEQLPTLPKNATRYDLVNLVTAMEHTEKDQAYGWLGGNIVGEFHHHLCNNCQRPV